MKITSKPGNGNKVHIYIDGELQPDLTLENFTTSDEERSITIPPQSHGMHKIKAVLSTGAGGADVRKGCGVHLEKGGH